MVKKKKKKDVKKKINRAQVTIFIIVAILIVVIVAIFFLYQSKVLTLNSNRVPAQIAPVQDYVNNCVKETGENAVYYIGQTGGYLNSPNFSTEYGIAYYYSDGKSYMPTKERVEKELGDYMSYMLPFCTGDFTDLTSFSVSPGKITTDAKIDSGKVTYTIDYPLTITKDTKTYSLNNFEGSVPVRLDKVIDLASKINQEQLVDGEDICLSCMQEWTTNTDLYVEMNDYGNKTGIIIFTIRDPQSQLKNTDYRFYFANKYKIV